MKLSTDFGSAVALHQWWQGEGVQAAVMWSFQFRLLLREIRWVHHWSIIKRLRMYN
jgi:hypothetical protein